MTDKTPEEQAVIEAAEAWDITYPTTSAGHTDSVIALQNALATLRASRTPKGVKPEDVELGAKFSFPGNALYPGVYVLVSYSGQPMWVDAKGEVRPFSVETRIIPIQEEEGGECEHE